MPRLPLLALCALAIACSRSSASVPPPEPPLQCDAAAPTFPPRLMVGFSGSDATAASPGFDLRYQYIAGALAPSADCLDPARPNAVGCGTQWWGTWQWDQDPPGAFARGFVATAEADGLLPMFTYYVSPGSRRGRGRELRESRTFV